jgi:hypothetical protein
VDSKPESGARDRENDAGIASAGMRWLPARRGDLAAIVLGAIIMVAIGLLIAFPRARTNWGFGPEWDCISTSHDEPICFKKNE